jgi:DNA-binding NtrC family response regulator
MVQLSVPALRERVQDLPLFVQFFSRKFAERYSQASWEPTAEELAEFCEYHWPGNIRQLSQVIEQGYVLATRPRIPPSKLSGRREASLPYFNLDRLRRTALQQALRATQGHKGRAARLLGVHANTLTRMLAELEMCSGDE